MPTIAPPISYASAYAGAGGMDRGLEAAGWQCAWSNEIDADAVATHGSITHPGSIDDVAWPAPGSVDVVVGGPPCQGFSAAGLLDPDDPRSRHVHTFFDLVEYVRPAAFVMENVANLSRARWRPLRDALIERAQAMGYHVTAQVVDAADHGTAQHRQRTVLLGSLTGPIPELTPTTGRVSAREVLAGIEGPDAERGARIVPTLNPALYPSPQSSLMFNGAGRVLDLDAPSRTVTASFGGNHTHIVDTAALADPDSAPAVVGYHRALLEGRDPGPVPGSWRRLTIAEAAALQGFAPDTAWVGAKTKIFRQIGNAVPPPLARAIGEHLSAHMRGHH